MKFNIITYGLHRIHCYCFREKKEREKQKTWTQTRAWYSLLLIPLLVVRSQYISFTIHNRHTLNHSRIELTHISVLRFTHFFLHLFCVSLFTLLFSLILSFVYPTFASISTTALIPHKVKLARAMHAYHIGRIGNGFFFFFIFLHSLEVVSVTACSSGMMMMMMVWVGVELADIEYGGILNLMILFFSLFTTQLQYHNCVYVYALV